MTLQLSFFFGEPRFGRPRPVRGPATKAGGNDVADPPSRPRRQKASKGVDKPWGADDTARGQQEFHRSHPPPVGSRWRDVCSANLRVAASVRAGWRQASSFPSSPANIGEVENYVCTTRS